MYKLSATKYKYEKKTKLIEKCGDERKNPQRNIDSFAQEKNENLLKKICLILSKMKKKKNDFRKKTHPKKKEEEIKN